MDVAKEYQDLAGRNEPEGDENCYGISNYSFFVKRLQLLFYLVKLRLASIYLKLHVKKFGFGLVACAKKRNRKFFGGY